jgi:P27 family predicted phage terminase small subunit
MGKRGPAPKPTALKLLQGTYRQDRAARNEPVPEVSVPSCPSWLHAEAKREWRRIVPELERLGLITTIDRAALAAYCQAYAEWWEMERDIAQNGRWQLTETGYEAQRPAVSIRSKALDHMKAFLKEFGLTPSSRTRVSSDKKDAPSGNPFLDAMNG